MLLSCNSCQKEYVASHKTSGEPFVCSKCQGRNKEPEYMRLGLHPALERKFAPEEKKNRVHKHSSNPVSRLSLMPQTHSRSDRLSDLSSMPQIPGFDIAYQVGRGAMGSVYRAREKKTGRLVAIKVLSHELSQRSDLVARFEREAYALKSLTDKNVVAIIDAGHVEDIHYFAMEFIDGITLRTRINRGSLSLAEAAYITSQMLSGLKAAHKHGIIHRDLKPENVLLAYDKSDFSALPDRVVLVDFGLVGIGGLVFDPHPNLTKSRVTMGTVNYMAPEQHIDAKRVDHRSDIYSAGVIFFEMLTGDLPIGRYLMPGERELGLPSQVDTILARALARTLDQRYWSADQFIEDLESLNNEPSAEESRAHAAQVQFSEVKGQVLRMLYKFRYPILAVAAALFFAWGIKLSIGEKHIEKAEPKAATRNS